MVRSLGQVQTNSSSAQTKVKAQQAILSVNSVSAFTLGASEILMQPRLILIYSFLVSPTVRVSSLPPATPNNPNPQQHTFVSSSSGDSFEVFPDPRGNTLGRGTEIELDIKDEEKEWLSTNRLRELMWVGLPRPALGS